VPYGPLAIVGGLTLGDYLLWNWSLNANHDVLALVSGLTLPPLAIVCLWLLALTVARLLARTSRSSNGRATNRTRRTRTRRRRARQHRPLANSQASPGPACARATSTSAHPSSASTRSSHKIAA
jgi:hypothetical protein